MSDNLSFFVPIAKVEKQADGSRLVSGYASTPTKDFDGEIVSLDAIKNALPAYWEWRNIRQMHQPIAVGVAQEANVDADGLYLTAKIVEEKCVKLIDEGVLKGFSIGGRRLGKEGDTITELELIEVSIVDRPGNPDCRFEVIKAAKPVGDGKIALVRVAEPMAIDDLVIPAADVGPLRKFFTTLFGKGGDQPGDGSKPYGDVDYADPGYQDDKKKRYPLDNEKHIRAAWSYINKPKNAKKYSAEQVSKIRAKIVAAWKAKIDKDGPPSADKAATIGKSLGDAARCAMLIQELEWLRSGAAFEAFLEDDGSEIPGQIRSAIETLCGILNSWVAEETEELIAASEDGEAKQAAIAAIVELTPSLRDALAKFAPTLCKQASDTGADTAGATLDPNDDASVFDQLKGAIKMAENDVTKRFGAAHKAAISKASSSLNKAMASHKAGMASLGKAASLVMGAKKAATALPLEELLKSDGLAGHISKAHEHFSDAADHHEMAAFHLAKAAGASVGGGEESENDVGGNAGEVDQSHLTEGDVPGYPADGPYQGKGAGVFIPKELFERLVAAEAGKAAAEARVEVLSSLPAGPSKARTFVIGKNALPGTGTGAGEQANAMETLFKGVNVNPQDPDSATQAATAMLANMFGAPQIFAKSVTDPSFRGAATKRAN